MSALIDQQTGRAVRDQLEQALFALPRDGYGVEQIALQIEEAIELAIEMEFKADPKPSKSSRGRDKPIHRPPAE